MLGASPAVAAQAYPYLSQLTGSATANGSFGNPYSTAVDDQNGYTYVADSGPDVVYVFDTSTGDYVTTLDGSDTPAGSFGGGQVTVAADNATGDVYVTDSSDGVVDILGPSGSYIGQILGSSTPAGSFGNVQGVAVDQATGEVYVSDNGNEVIDVFSSTGTYLSQINGSATANGSFSYVTSIAVDDQSGDLLIADSGPDLVYQYTTSGAYVATWSGSGTPAGSFGSGQVAVGSDNANGDVFVSDSADNVVDAFESSGDYLGQITGQSTPNGSFVNAHGVSIDQATGDIDVSDTGNEVIDVFSGTPVTVPDVSTGQASGVSFTGATLNGSVNPDGTQITSCQFQYVANSQYQAGAANPYSAGHTAPCSQTPSGSTPVAVHASVTGLSQGTVYDYRLLASNSNGTSYGANQTFATGPSIDSESAGSVGTQTATLDAQINPNGQSTTYQLQYGTVGPCSTNPCANAPATAQNIGSGTNDVSVSQTITGLSTGTTYYWRAVATSSAGTVDGTGQSFTTQAPTTPPSGSCPNAQYRAGYGSYLPDCRAYEQATPVDKNGNNAEGFVGAQSEASTSGDQFMYWVGTSGEAGGLGAQTAPYYLASRSASGWSSQGLLPSPAGGFTFAITYGWSQDLSEVLGEESRNDQDQLYVRSSADGSLQMVGQPATTSNAGQTYFDAMSKDDSEVMLDNNAQPLTPNAAGPSGTDNAYVFDRATSTLSLVGVLPDGSIPANGSFGGAYDWGDADPGAGGADGAGYFTQAENVLSEDGSSAFFTAAADSGRDSGVDQVFVRENPTSTNATTVQVSASQRTNGSGAGGTDPNGPQPAAFMDATPDGSHVLFTSGEELTNDADTGSADQGNDLYAYEMSSGTLTDLSLPDAGITDSDPNGAEVQGVLGMSDDGSYVYYAANGVLAPGASAGDCNGSPGNGLARSGTCNLYVWHNGVNTFIATLTANNNYGMNSSLYVGPLMPALSNALNWTPSGALPDFNGQAETAARVTPDGQTLLFMSNRSLTGYDNAGYSELYRYQAASGELQCVSCDPTGATAGESASETSISTGQAADVVPTPVSELTRNLSASGDQVFFETSDPLVARATNGVQNVYEWEADGAGSCQSTSQDGGCLYLISSGQSPDASYFADASASGNDVFFFTSQGLVGQDQDQLVDVYDARVDGGLASQEPLTPTPCSDDTCHGPAGAPPPPPIAATVTFSGPGNPTPTRAAKARVLTRTVRGAHFMVRVRVPGAGQVDITGTGIGRVSRRVARAGTHELEVTLTPKSKHALRRKGELRLRLHVRYAPEGAAASVATVTVTVKTGGDRRARHAPREATYGPGGRR